MVVIGSVGLASGILVLLGGVLLHLYPEQHSMWGALILAFSIISILGMGGFLVGAIIGIVAGALTLGIRSNTQ